MAVPNPSLQQSTAPAAWQAQLAQQVTPPVSEASDEEQAWLAAVTNAKARAQRLEQSPVAEEEAEEDWESLMSAARQRTNAEAEAMYCVPSQPAPPPDAASFQVERGAIAANDDRSPVSLSAVPTVEAREDEEWLRLRSEVEAKERAESERKLRAIREIRRLRGGRGNTRQVATAPPQRSRMGVGTAGPPVEAGTPTATRSSGKDRALIMKPGPVAGKVQPPKSPAAARAQSLPRITQRLKNSS